MYRTTQLLQTLPKTKLLPDRCFARRWLLWAWTLLLATTLSGCGQIAYYAQATKGQLSIISKRQSVEALLLDPKQSPKLHQSLRLAQEVRAFATNELGLPDNNTFRYYSDLGRPYAVWNVIAAPRFSLIPKTWCFPIAGCVSYKGYFAQKDAEELNDQLVATNHDTFLYGVSAYSTLGWFSDPLLNTFIDYNEISLAGLIFHELAHQVVYVQDDSRFNEAFATAVELEGLRRWVNASENSAVFQQYVDTQNRNHRITQMVLSFRARLIELYQSFDETQSQAQKDALKKEVFSAMETRYAQMKQDGEGTAYYDWWFTLPLNNAHLIAVATYHDLVPAFTKLIQNHDSLPAFFEEIDRISKLKKNQRDAVLDSLITQ